MLTKKQLTTQLNRLVAMETLTENAAENNMALKYIQALISPKAKIQEIKNKNTSIFLAGNYETKTPDFGYLVHIDVVAAPKQMFVMCQKKNIVFGRGVSDMKFSVPLGVAILNELIEKKSGISFCLAITTDEEIGGFDGAGYLANEFGWRPKTLIVLDGGDNFRLINKSKGVAQFIITAKGKSAHASRPWDGANALLPLCKLVIELEKRYGKNSCHENWNTTINYGQLHGGTSTNQVCNQAVLKLDYRYPESDSIHRIKTELKEVIDNIDPTLVVENGPTGLPCFTDASLPMIKSFLNCLRTELGKEIVITGSFGTSDIRHFSQFNIPAIMIKPIGGDIHGENEYLNLDSTMKLYQALRKFILKKGGKNEKTKNN